MLMKTLIILCICLKTVSSVTDEEFVFEQASGLNCTAYTTVSYSNLLYPNQNNTTALNHFIYENWNCSNVYGAQVCAAGLYSLKGSVACSIPCPRKYYCPGNGTAILCPNGSFSISGASNPSCTPCMPNYFCIFGEQFVCPPRYLSNGGSETCNILCPRGYKCTGNGLKEICPVGTYSLEGSENCTICEAGYLCKNAYEHDFCPPNTWSLPGSAISCSLPCPTGVVCPGNGRMECTVCKSNEYTVKKCSDMGDTICNVSCPAGMFGAFYTKGMCENCPVGTEMPYVGSSTCTSCTDGYFSNITGLSGCKKCDVGTSTSASSGYINCIQVIYMCYLLLRCNIYTK
jgi:hypothetical protein